MFSEPHVMLLNGFKVKSAIFDQCCPLSQASLYHNVFRMGFVIILKYKD